MVTCYIYDINNLKKNEKDEIESDNYYKNADGCLIVYDITNKKSFDEIKNFYIPKIKKKCKNNIKVILLGNKCDLEYLREVNIDEGTKLASENGFYFKETSCVENKNVADAFQAIIEMTNFEKYKKELKKKNGKCILI